MYTGAYVCRMSAVTQVCGTYTAAYVFRAFPEKDVTGKSAVAGDRGLSLLLDVCGTLRGAHIPGTSRIGDIHGTWAVADVCGTFGIPHICSMFRLPDVWLTSAVTDPPPDLEPSTPRNKNASGGKRTWASGPVSSPHPDACSHVDLGITLSGALGTCRADFRQSGRPGA
jgi:hypothetical protein